MCYTVSNRALGRAARDRLRHEEEKTMEEIRKDDEMKLLDQEDLEKVSGGLHRRVKYKRDPDEEKSEKKEEGGATGGW